jgi:hypothetical protein
MHEKGYIWYNNVPEVGKLKQKVLGNKLTISAKNTINQKIWK